MAAISERFNNPGPRARSARTVQARVALSTPRTGCDQGTPPSLRNYGTRFTLTLDDGRSLEIDLDHDELDFLVRARADFDAIYGRPEAQPAPTPASPTVEQLRAQGHAVVVFTPDELRGLEPACVEDRLIAEGNTTIDLLADPEPDEDDEDDEDDATRFPGLAPTPAA